MREQRPRDRCRGRHVDLAGQRLGGAAVVGVQDQLALAPFADPLPDAGAANQISRQLGLLLTEG